MPWANKTIVFDLDGTLVDTAPDLHAALSYAFELDGLKAVSLDTIRHAIGHGARAMIKRSAELSEIELDEASVTRLHESFLEYYVAHIADLSRPFDDIETCLKLCKSRNAKLSVCTNKTQALAEEVLQALNLTQYFDSIVGADRASQKKPAAAHIKEAVDLADGSLENAIMIGDSSTDGKAAQAAGIPFIFMTYGYADDAIEQCEILQKLDSADTLTSVLETWINQAS